MVKFSFTHLGILLVTAAQLHNYKAAGYTNYQTEVVCSSAYDIQRPSNVDELRQIVFRAISLNSTVKALGALHSTTDIICTDGIPIEMSRINYVRFDNAANTVTAGGGTALGDLIEELKIRGRALDGHLPSYGGVTVGGGLGTGVRGASLLHPVSISSLVIRMTIIDGTGKTVIIDETQHPEDLDAFRVHLGLLGIIVDATFRTVPAYNMKIEHYRISDSVLLGGFPVEAAREFDWTQFWWFPNTRSVVASKGKYVGLNVTGHAKVYQVINVTQLMATIIRNTFEHAQKYRSRLLLKTIERLAEYSFYQQVPQKQAYFSEDGGKTLKNPAIGYAHDLTTNRCTPGNCGWEFGIYPIIASFALPIEEFDAVVKTIKSILKQYPAHFPFIGILLKFAAPATGMMSNEFGRETFNMEIVTSMRRRRYTTARAGLAAYQAIAQAMVFEHGGRPHWSSNGAAFHSREVIMRSAPNLAKFRTYLNKYDPNGLFMNNFGRRVTGVSNQLTLSKEEQHCALMDSCFCVKNSDCADGQECETFRSFKVCRDVFTETYPRFRLLSSYQR